MSGAHVVSVLAGGRSALSFNGERVSTAIFKQALARPAYITSTGIRGDVQVDRKNHGGPDKAVCVYPERHYRHWADSLGSLSAPGLFGENLTVSELTEETVHIGDSFRVGETVVEVSQPRQPCHKLSRKVGDGEFAARVIEAGLTGWYFRVLSPGYVAAGDDVVLEARDAAGVTVAYANDVMYRRTEGRDPVDRLLAVGALSDSWRETLEGRRT